MGLLCIFYYIAMGVIVRFNQSVAWIWPLAGGLCIVRFLFTERKIRTGKRPPWPRWLTVAFHTFLAIGFAWFFTVEGFVFFNSFEQGPEDLDYIIVLGGKVNGTEPSGVLLNRIEYAYEYMAANPGTIAIASGGQGPDEGISEAQCIFNGLVARGIDPSRIWLEEQATSTEDNLAYSFAMINDPAKTVGIVTNNFHMFRSLRLAAAAFPEYDVHGISVHTTPLSYPHYMVREALATTVEALHGNMTFF